MKSSVSPVDTSHRVGSHALHVLRIMFFALIFAMPAAMHAQRDFTRIYGSEDQSIPVPAFTGSLGQKDSAALQELIDYLKAVNISEWKGLKASGTISHDAGAGEQATLAISGGSRFRLNVQTPKGERSTRIGGSYGKTLAIDGKFFTMPAATAKAGLVAFPRLLEAAFPDSTTSLIDRGQIQLDSRILHRLTVEESAFPSSPGAAQQQNISVVDLYFDSFTHLLVKSASAIQLDSADRQRYLVVVTYDDYQKVQDSLIPFRYSQSMNGQAQWTLQLTNADLQPSFDPSYFQF